MYDLVVFYDKDSKSWSEYIQRQLYEHTVFLLDVEEVFPELKEKVVRIIQQAKTHMILFSAGFSKFMDRTPSIDFAQCIPNPAFAIVVILSLDITALNKNQSRFPSYELWTKAFISSRDYDQVCEMVLTISNLISSRRAQNSPNCMPACTQEIYGNIDDFVHEKNTKVNPTNINLLERLLLNCVSPKEVMCEALRLDETSRLDEKLSEMFESSMPEGKLLHIFDDDEVVSVVYSQKEVPTLLHFAAKYGLSRLCNKVLTCPGVRQAYNTKNRYDEHPDDLAMTAGYTELAETIRHIVGKQPSGEDPIYMTVGDVAYTNFAPQKNDGRHYDVPKWTEILPEPTEEKERNETERNTIAVRRHYHSAGDIPDNRLSSEDERSQRSQSETYDSKPRIKPSPPLRTTSLKRNGKNIKPLQLYGCGQPC